MTARSPPRPSAAFTIEALRESKIRIAIDDFGTGYSSFITLRDVTADRLKIDRTFITDIHRRREDLLIVKNVIELAHGLGLEVVAEGVETEDQWRILSDLGCDIAQGYGIAMPMSILDLRAWVAKRTIRHEEAPRLVILVWVTGIGVASALFTWTRLRRLAELPIRHLWLVWLALGVQLVLFEYLGRRIPLPVSDKIHLGTYAGTCLPVAQPPPPRRLAGRDRYLFNLAAIVANDGSMPANMEAWRKAGMRDPARGVRELAPCRHHGWRCSATSSTSGVVATVERVQHRRRAHRHRFDVPRPSLVLTAGRELAAIAGGDAGQTAAHESCSWATSAARTVASVLPRWTTTSSRSGTTTMYWPS